MIYDLPFRWHIGKLWKLKLPVEWMNVRQLTWVFALDDEWRQVLQNPKKHRDHWKRATLSDLRYPIHVLRWQGRWWVLDGVHRLMKTVFLLGERKIRVKKVPPAMLPLIKTKHGRY